MVLMVPIQKQTAPSGGLCGAGQQRLVVECILPVHRHRKIPVIINQIEANFCANCVLLVDFVIQCKRCAVGVVKPPVAICKVN